LVRVQKVLNLDLDIVKKLEAYSESKMIPQSRIVEKLLMDFFDKGMVYDGEKMKK